MDEDLICPLRKTRSMAAEGAGPGCHCRGCMAGPLPLLRGMARTPASGVHCQRHGVRAPSRGGGRAGPLPDAG